LEGQYSHIQATNLNIWCSNAKKTKLCYFDEIMSYYNQQKFYNVTKSVILDLDSRVKNCA